jgi:hypothetical protein
MAPREGDPEEWTELFEGLLWVQAVQKRFFSLKNCTQPGTIRVDTTV